MPAATNNSTFVSAYGKFPVRLTLKEIQVLQLIADGLSSEMASELQHVSKRTVDFHLVNIYDKLHVNNRVAAIGQAARLGLIAFTPSWASASSRHAPRVTPTELEVLELALSGLSSSEIAATRLVSKRTVDFHFANLFDKFACDNRVALLRSAWACRVIDPESAWGIAA